MDWLTNLVHAHWILRVLTAVVALGGIAWSLRTLWRLHAVTARQRQEDAAKRRQARIRTSAARQPIATPPPVPTPPPDDPRQEDLLSALASQETGRIPATDLGHAETRRLGAPAAPAPRADADDEDDEAAAERETRYPIDGGAVTRRDLRPQPKDASTHIVPEAPPQGLDGNLQAAIRDAVEDSLREDGSETFFKDFADAEHGLEATNSTTTGIADDDQAWDIGAETTNRILPPDTGLTDDDEDAAATTALDHEDSSQDATPEEAVAVDDDASTDDDLEARRRQRRVSQEIIHHNAQRHEELGLHIGITPDGQSEADVAISAEDKQRRLRQLGLAESSDDEDAPAPVADVMARVEAAISAMGGEDDDEISTPSVEDDADQLSPDEDETAAEEDDVSAGDHNVDAAEPAPDTAPAAPSLSVPDWARSDTFDEDLEDDGGNAPRQHQLFD